MTKGTSSETMDMVLRVNSDEQLLEMVSEL